jgi:hypothetical protein
MLQNTHHVWKTNPTYSSSFQRNFAMDERSEEMQGEHREEKKQA